MEKFDLREWSGFSAAIKDNTKTSVIDQIVIDSRRLDSPDSLFVALPGEYFDGHAFVQNAFHQGARFALVKKDYRPSIVLPENAHLLHVENPLRSFQEICQAYRKKMNIPVLAITGSFGKTMLKDLLSQLLSISKKVSYSPESFNSQIGVALSLLQIHSSHDLAIIEAGISKPGEMELLAQMLSPDFAILTCVGSAHLSSLHSLENIAKEKMKLLSCVSKTGWIIKPFTCSEPDIKSTIVYWDRPEQNLPHIYAQAPNSAFNIPCRCYFPIGKEITFTIPYEMPFLIDLLNIAVKAAWLLGLDAQKIEDAINKYKPEPMQTEIWTSTVGATFINDSYSADPVSVAMALRNLRQFPDRARKYFIFGGLRSLPRKEKTAAKQIAEAICEAKVDHLYLADNHSLPSLENEILSRGTSPQISFCRSYGAAIEAIRPLLKKDDAVLLQGPTKEGLSDLQVHDLIGDNQLIVNLSAIQSNLETIRNTLSKSTRIMVMVKAQAYGTDPVIIARFVLQNGADIIGVAHVDEGVALRRAGITGPIFIINCALYEVSKLVQWGFEVGISSIDIIQAIAQEATLQNRKIKVHLHVDTGMSRLGCRPEDALGFAQKIRDLQVLDLEGLMTHLACAELVNEDPFTFKQIDCFRHVHEQLRNHGITPPWIHVANSAATLRSLMPEANMMRIGFATFGLYPSEITRALVSLQPALTLMSRIAGINLCKQGETISYGRTYVVQRETERIGVVPLGYFDGIHRHYSGKGFVLVHGKPAPLVGRICMDFFMIDLTGIPNVRIGDPVLIFGRDSSGKTISPDEFATRADTSAYELITCLGPRIQRIFIKNEH